MNKYQVRFKKSALKELRKLPNSAVGSITTLIERLSSDPRPKGCKKLKGYSDLWRVRVGNYRIIYTFEDNVMIIEILEIGDRKNIY